MYSTNSAFFESGPHSFNFYIVQNALSVDPTKTHHLLFSLRERVFISLLLFCLQFQKQKKNFTLFAFFCGVLNKVAKKKDASREPQSREASQTEPNFWQLDRKMTEKYYKDFGLYFFIVIYYSRVFWLISLSLYLYIYCYFSLFSYLLLRRMFGYCCC